MNAAGLRVDHGWVAKEALEVSFYRALVAADDFAAGVRLAMNHSGDSERAGAITGSLLNALLSEGALRERWLERPELRAVIEGMAEDTYAAVTGDPDRVAAPEWMARSRPG